MLVIDRLIGLASPEAALRRAVRLSHRGKAAEAFPLLTRSAKAGIADAEYRVACCYLEGAGVPASRVEGARWLQRAAGHGHVEAQTLLGGLCVHGLAGGVNGDRPERLFAEEEPGEPDFASALKWARQAAEAGSAKAQAVLAYVLTCRPEEMRDLEEAHRWYQRSAASGCPEGCLGYALSLAPRTQDEAGRQEVAENLRQAAEAELPTAIYLLAVLTEQGVGVERDPVVAAQLYCHAAERGQRSAQLRWGLALMEGRDVEQDLVLGESWLRRAALAGDPDAAALVGDLYVKNGRLPPNYTEAAGWYRRAAEAGHTAGAAPWARSI
jgi:TPR repeat protein